MRYIAHRGKNQLALENTLPAFRFAFDDTGVDGVELDVQLAGCGTPIVFHDDDLRRLYGINGTPKDFTADELRRLKPVKAERFPDADPDEMYIASLDEVLDAFPDGYSVNVELKAAAIERKSVTGPAAEVLRDYTSRLDLLVSSFNPIELARLANLIPGTPRALLFGVETPYLLNYGWPTRFLARFGGLKAVHPNWELVSPDLVRRAHERGLEMNVWTVNEPVRAEWLEREGVDGLITDALRREV